MYKIRDLQINVGGIYLYSRLLWRLRQEEHEFWASLENLPTPCLKNNIEKKNIYIYIFFFLKER
jgi:undecaprenyl pyrophosphate synthase